MIVHLIALALHLAIAQPPPPPPIPMIAGRYAPWVMQRVAIKRHLAFRSHGGLCGMATDLPYPLGSFLHVEGVRTGIGRDCQIIDVSQTRDRARHVHARLIELDAPSALAICGKRFYRSRAKECPVIVTEIQQEEERCR